MGLRSIRSARYVVLGVLLAVVAAACGSAQAESAGAGVATDAGVVVTEPRTGGDVAVEIVLEEFGFDPDPVTLPAGETVVLTLRNDGAITHEFMLGQGPQEMGGYGVDLLAEMQPEVISGEGFMVEGFEGEDHGDDHADEEAAVTSHNEATEATDDGHDEGEATDDGHDEAGGHGAMVAIDPGGEVTIRIQVPDDAAGTWEMGCFLSGHYQAGMHGTVIVTG